jgi:SSS family transporter
LYTTIGGVKAVIWTDTLQLLILFGGLAVSAAVILQRTGGAAVVWSVAQSQHKLRLFDFSLDPRNEFTFWGGLLGGIFVLLSQYGVNQAELQKMLTTSSVERSRVALISSMTVASLVGLAYFLIGAGLFVFYSQHPEKGAAAMNPDRVFPRFIIEELPPGIKGVLMAAVAAAAMSAISSVLNAITTVLTSDFYNRLSGRTASVATARRLTLVVGIGCTIAALYVDRLGNLLVAATRLQNFFGGSLTGAFLLGMTTRRANGTGAFWGVVIGTCGVALLAATTSISWMWHGLFAAALAYGSGWALSRLGPAPSEKTAALVWSPRR